MMIEKQTDTLTGPERLEAYEDNWQTEMGAWFPGERVVLRGKDVFTELNNQTWMEFFIYGLTGKSSKKIAQLLEGVWVISTSFPDPRLWNNRVAALAATCRSTGVLATAAGVSVSEANIYGLKPIKGSIDFLYRAAEKLKNGEPLEKIIRKELKTYRTVHGYGRPLTNADERVEPLLKFANSIGAGNGPYVKLAFEIEEWFKESRYKYQINIAAVSAALFADCGILPNEKYYMATLAFVAGIYPCYIDSLEKPEGAFMPLSTKRIHYRGKNQLRTWNNA
ncbi:MAG: hypothetical protein AB9Q19_07240 [Candidatus Reddybacter sp.]